MQLVINVVQNRHAGEQKSHWDTNCPFKIMYAFFLSCPTATFALQHGGFEPRELQAILQRAYLLYKKTEPPQQQQPKSTNKQSR